MDNDGIPDAEDLDDDNDSVEDGLDAFPLNPWEWRDTDGDGIGDNTDSDDDNDTVLDVVDNCPLVAGAHGDRRDRLSGSSGRCPLTVRRMTTTLPTHSGEVPMANTQCIRQVVGIALGLLAWTSAQGGGPYSIHTVSPCRVVDTREADGALSTFSGGPLTPGETVAFHVLGAAIAGQGGASDCGVPSSATGVFINIVAVGPSGAGDSGFLTLYPYGETLPLASTINYAYDTTAVANGVMVPVCDSAVATCDYSLNAYNHVALSVDLVIDVTGYLTD